jgi:nucleotide-binding universal stress UspA family protein
MYKSMLVPTDGSKLSVKAVAAAISLAKACGAKVTFLHVMPNYREYVNQRYVLPLSLAAPVEKKLQKEAVARSKQIVEDTRAQAVAAGVESAAVSVVHASPYEAIVKQATKSRCDLIVMASHGRKGLEGLLLGSETTKVLVHCKVPVLVIR